jgi:hypothetical protein
MFRLGSLITGTHAYPIQWPRPLIDDEDSVVAIVDSCAGPAVVGEMTEDDAVERFPEDERFAPQS